MRPQYQEHRCPDGTKLGLTTVDGQGAPIILLHGFTGNSDSMLALAAGLDRDRPKVLVDLVGHGRSEAPSDLFAYDMGSVVDQVLSIVAQYQERTVDLVGYSMGGRVAVSTAVRAPRFFRSLTMLSSTAGIADPVLRSERYVADQVRADELELIGTKAFLTSWLHQPLFAPLRSGMTDSELVLEIERRCVAQPIGWANSLRATGTGSMPPVWDEIHALDFPVLAIAGALDSRYVDFAQQLAQHARAGRFVVVENAGHAVHIENPEEVARQINEFL